GGGDPVSRAAKAALAEATDGREVVLLGFGPAEDRYGRTNAFVAVRPAAEPSSSTYDIARTIQSSLLAQGLARVSARVGDRACARHLLAAEHAARTASLGVWADPYYVIRK